MGKYARELSSDIIEFIQDQKVFFVATAPSDEGRINLSPKGYDCLVIVNPTTVAYLDYAGSGNETANHILDNRKITFMWCSFEANPLILRVYGYGRVIEKGTDEYSQWMNMYFPAFQKAAARQIFVIDVEAAQTSCGFGVPFMEYKGDREKMGQWTENQVTKGTLDEYIHKNEQRLDSKFPLGK